MERDFNIEKVAHANALDALKAIANAFSWEFLALNGVNAQVAVIVRNHMLKIVHRKRKQNSVTTVIEL